MDTHLHDGGETGICTIQRIIDYTRDYAMAGKVAISHLWGLGHADEDQLQGLAAGLTEQRISMFTTEPLFYAASFGARTVPWPIPINAGARVRVINDTINDHLSPIGTAI